MIKKIKNLAAILIAVAPFSVMGQDCEKYSKSSAVEEKLELTAYYPVAGAYIGQFKDTSHQYFNFRTRQNVWVEPETESGFGFVTAELGVKKIPVYPVMQARFNSHTSLWGGANVYLSDNKFVSKYMEHFQIAGYRNMYHNQYLWSAYFQTKPAWERVFLEGFGNYFAYDKTYKVEIELGIKITHNLAFSLGYEEFTGEERFLFGLRFELYEHKNRK